MHGRFVWTELASTDVERAKRFYSEVLGWSFEPFDVGGGDYWVARSGDELVGGIGSLETGSLPETGESYWFSFLGVDDLDRRLEVAKALGATVLEGPVDVPNVGRIVVIRDPTGAAVGWLMSE